MCNRQPTAIRRRDLGALVSAPCFCVCICLVAMDRGCLCSVYIHLAYPKSKALDSRQLSFVRRPRTFALEAFACGVALREWAA